MTFWTQTIFEVAGHKVPLDRIVWVSLGLVVLYVLGMLLRKRWLAKFFHFEETQPSDQRTIRRLVLACLLAIGALVILLGLGLDFTFQQEGNSFWTRMHLSLIAKALLIYFIARLVDEMLSGLLTRRYQQRREQQIKESGSIYNIESTGSRIKVGYIVQPIVYLMAAMFIIQELSFDIKLPLPWVKEGNAIYMNTVLSAALILLFTRLFLWVITEIVLYPYYKQKEINVGSQFAINRLLTYFVLVIAVVATLQYVGINLTVLLGGTAALLVGVGLGLQQTFNDLICGIILLFERTVEVGDVVDLQGLIGRVKRIGLRTSLVETRDNFSVIVPNSKLVGDNVINWSHTDAKARFKVSVGVAYGSDTQLVKQILHEVAAQHTKVARRPEPIVRFANFGESALDFELIFWSRELMPIENIKSDLRFAIDQRFREAKVAIPFPQRDVWIRKVEE